MKKLDAIGISGGIGKVSLEESTSQIPRPAAPKPRERDINAGIKALLELDGWHVLLMETLWREDWRKGTGEVGMPDLLAIRYDDQRSSRKCWAEVLWCEGKSPGGKLSTHQRIWIEAERKRGAMVWVSGDDFAVSVDGFLTHYRESGLMRREIQ